MRPAPVFVAGRVQSYGFDLQNATFTMEIEDATAPGDDDPSTEVFLPEFHFPMGHTQVETSSGRWSIETEDVGPSTEGEERTTEAGVVQMLRWRHGAGKQNIIIRGVKRRLGVALGTQEEEAGYVEQCQQTAGKCQIM